MSRNMRSRFEQLAKEEAEAKRKATEKAIISPTPLARQGSILGGGASKCYICSMTVYINERVELGEERAVHRPCFKCCKCGGNLSLETVVVVPAEQALYCKVHAKERALSVSTPTASAASDSIGDGDDSPPPPPPEDDDEADNSSC